MEANSKKILSLKKIFKSYEANVVIDNFSFDIDYGESVGIFGKNGSGKSTILKICCGLIQPDSGSISVMGKSFSSSEESLQIKSRMGVMLHDDMIYPQLTVKENLVFYSKILGIKNTTENIQKISSLLDIDEYMNVPVIKLSNGNKRRASLGKSLLNNPDILIADEPESNLDDKGKEIVSKVLSNRRKRGLTNFFSTHSKDFLKECSSKTIKLNGATKL